MTFPKILIVTLLISLLSLPLQGTTLDNIGGYLSLSEVRTTVDAGQTTRNLRQEYSGSWSESLSEYLRIEGGYRYYSLDQDQAGQIGIWRKESLPSLRIDFNHPLVTISSYAQERRSRGQSSFNDLTQKNVVIGLRTRSLEFPLLSTNYSRIHNYGQPGEAGRNILERQLSVSLDHSLDNIDLSYNFNHSINNNKVTLLETNTTSHQFRSILSGMSGGKRKLNYSATYQVDYSSRTDHLPNSQILIHSIPVLNGLYLDQGDPSVGDLEIIPLLTDGNRSQPTNPVIEIGSGLTGRHLGVDLGTVRSIGALYIYCDQVSDENLQWSIYASDANFSWQLHDINPDIIFNTIENRYEITFDTIRTQYLKAINNGFNQIDNVIVTELEALQRVASDGEVTQSSTSHSAYLSGTIMLSETINLHSDVTYQREPSVGLSGRRDNIYSTSSLYYRLSEVAINSLILQQNYQLYKGMVADVSDYSLQYNLRYDPLKTLSMSWSALGRLSNYDYSRNSEDLNFSWRGIGTPLPGMTVRLSTSYARNKRLLNDQTSSSWNRQVSFDGQLTKSTTATISYDNIQTKVDETSTVLKRDRYAASLLWRVTSQINMRGTLHLSRGGYRYDSNELFANWRMSSSISLSATFSRVLNSDGSTTDRKNFNSNYSISNRTSMYFSYIDNNFSQIGRDQSSSLQLGLRSNF